jgi:hypothetical protein
VTHSCEHFLAFAAGTAQPVVLSNATWCPNPEGSNCWSNVHSDFIRVPKFFNQMSDYKRDKKVFKLVRRMSVYPHTSSALLAAIDQPRKNKKRQNVSIN